MDSIRHKTKELLAYHRGCYGNLVTMATSYVADAYRPIPNMDLIQFNTKELQSNPTNFVSLKKDPVNLSLLCNPARILPGSCVGSYKIQDPTGSWQDFLPGFYT